MTSNGRRGLRSSMGYTSDASNTSNTESFREHYMVADEGAFSVSFNNQPNNQPVELTDEDLVYNPYTGFSRDDCTTQQAQQAHETQQATYTTDSMREIINAFALPRDFTDEQIESLVDQVNALTDNNNSPLGTRDMLSALSRSCRTANIFASAGVDNLNDENHRSNSSGFVPTGYTF